MTADYQPAYQRMLAHWNRHKLMLEGGLSSLASRFRFIVFRVAESSWETPHRRTSLLILPQRRAPLKPEVLPEMKEPPKVHIQEHDDAQHIPA